MSASGNALLRSGPGRPLRGVLLERGPACPADRPAGSAEVYQIGGINRPVAVVEDSDMGDVILVGEVTAGEGLSLDDLVVALRAVCEFGEVPFVSIDWTKDTDRTRKQRVRFGGASRTPPLVCPFEADVVLKKIALGQVSARVWGVTSYFDLATDRWTKTGVETPLVTRFWFTPFKTESFVAVREGVAVARQLKIVVRMEVMGAAGTDPPPDLSKLPAIRRRRRSPPH